VRRTRRHPPVFSAENLSALLVTCGECDHSPQAYQKGTSSGFIYCDSALRCFDSRDSQLVSFAFGRSFASSARRRLRFWQLLLHSAFRFDFPHSPDLRGLLIDPLSPVLTIELETHPLPTTPRLPAALSSTSISAGCAFKFDPFSKPYWLTPPA